MNNAHLMEYIEGLQTNSLETSFIYSDLDILNNVGLEIFHPNGFFLVRRCKIQYPNETLINSELADCSICLMNIECNNIIITLDCGHIFHANCLKKWVQNSCPYCRAIIN